MKLSALSFIAVTVLAFAAAAPATKRTPSKPVSPRPSPKVSPKIGSQATRKAAPKVRTTTPKTPKAKVDAKSLGTSALRDPKNAGADRAAAALMNNINGNVKQQKAVIDSTQEIQGDLGKVGNNRLTAAQKADLSADIREDIGKLGNLVGQTQTTRGSSQNMATTLKSQLRGQRAGDMNSLSGSLSEIAGDAGAESRLAASLAGATNAERNNILTTLAGDMNKDLRSNNDALASARDIGNNI